jgi:hypothetical protein
MVSMERAFHSERTLRQVTGLSIEEFEAVRPGFEGSLAVRGHDQRHRRSNAGRKPRLATGAENIRGRQQGLSAIDRLLPT